MFGVQQQTECGAVLDRSAGIEARLAYVYEASAWVGYVVRVQSLSITSQRLDPSRFVGADLVLVGAREMLLQPGETTLLYLVFGKKP